MGPRQMSMFATTEHMIQGHNADDSWETYMTAQHSVMLCRRMAADTWALIQLRQQLPNKSPEP